MANGFKIGDIDVLAVSDGSISVPGPVYYAGTTAEQWEPHRRWLNHEGNVEFTLGCFLVRSGDRRGLIDTGLGGAGLWGFRGGAPGGGPAGGGGGDGWGGGVCWALAVPRRRPDGRPGGGRGAAGRDRYGVRYPPARR